MKTGPLLASTAEQKIWNFFCQRPDQSFFSAEVSEQTLLSKGGTNQILRTMAHKRLLQIEKKGRMVFYKIDAKSPLTKQFKILRNVALSEEIIKKIKPLSERIVLFGSSAIGEDSQESDLDLFVVGREKEKIRTLIPALKDQRPIQLVIKTPQEFVLLDKKEAVFYGELQKGIVLWEKE